MIRISQLLFMFTSSPRKLHKQSVLRLKLFIANTFYESSRVRILNHSAEWNSNDLPLIEITSSCESIPLKVEIILDGEQVIGSGKSQIVSGRNAQDCVDITNFIDEYVYGKLLYKAEWLFLAQSKFSENRHYQPQTPRKIIKLTQVLPPQDSSCFCGTKKVKKTKKQKSKKKIPYANQLLLYEQDDLEKVAKVRKTHFPVQFYTKVKK